MASLSLIFDLIARDRASREFDNVGGAADRAGRSVGAIGAIAGGAAVAGVAALGAGLVSVFKGGLEELQGNQAALAQLSAGLQSTGNVAGVSAEQVAALANSIEAKTGTDGAAIVSGAALLATFTNVRNEVGAGNDVFARATEAGVDLAARGFGSVESNAVTLGKALNDPLKGITALGKQGITFTGEQKQVIKSLVASGQTLEAQKIILAEVEKQVGGSAEAYGKTLPGQIDRAQASFDGIKEQVNTAVLPAFNGLLGGLNDKLFPALGDLAAKHGPGVTDFFKNALIPAFRSVQVFIKDTLGPVFSSLSTLFIETVLPAIGDVARKITGGLGAALDSIKVSVDENRPAIDAIVSAFRAVVTFISENVLPILGPVIAESLRVLGVNIGTAIRVVGGIVTVFTSARDRVVQAKARFDEFRTAIGNLKVPKPLRDIADLVEDISRAIGKAAGGVGRFIGNIGDGPGRAAQAPRGGSTLSRVKGVVSAFGAGISSTYRTPERNRAVGGSPTSYHLDRENPAVDIVGTTQQLDAIYARLVRQGPWRELLWRVPNHAPGDNPHIHVAHSGGQVQSSWPRMLGDRPDERTARLQIGEDVIPRGGMADVLAELQALRAVVQRLPRDYQLNARAV